jgi:hypothetical protein
LLAKAEVAKTRRAAPNFMMKKVERICDVNEGVIKRVQAMSKRW